VERQALLIKAQTVADDFQRMHGALSDIRTGADQNVRSLAETMNGTLRQIAEVNDQIQQMEFQGDVPNDLRDRRDALIRDLSGKVGINYMEQADGTVSITLLQGPTLVDGKSAATMSVQTNPANNSYADVMLTLPGGGPPVNVSSIIGGPGNAYGEMGANLQVRDTLVNGFMADLDELAHVLATEVNSLHGAGYGLDGSTGLAFFSAPPAPVPPATFAAGYSSQITLALTNTQQIAAAGADPTAPGGGNGDNSRALQLAGLRDAAFSTSYGSYTLTSFHNAIVGKVGAAVQGAERAATQNTGTLQQLEIMREAAVGVSLDEELTKMLKYQKAYEAAAKLISTGAEMLDTVLGLVR
jgi:flagellar hook-associated protein 1 FlgK